MSDEKLIQLGWVDAQGRSLDWQYWQRNHRRAVGYWSSGYKPEPFFSAQPEQAKLRRNTGKAGVNVQTI